MKKSTILMTTLVSTALLGACVGNAQAASVKIHKENKVVTVAGKKAKVYKNEKLTGAKKVAQGTVYKVDGSFKKKKVTYYRINQLNAKNKWVRKGFISSKEVKGMRENVEIPKWMTAKEDTVIWKNLYKSKKVSTLKEERNYLVKSNYKLGNGKKVYTVYKVSSFGDEKLVGYVNQADLKKFVEEKEKVRDVVAKGKQYMWENLSFSGKVDISPSHTYQVRKSFVLSGKRYYALYLGNRVEGYATADQFTEKKVKPSTENKPSHGGIDFDEIFDKWEQDAQDSLDKAEQGYQDATDKADDLLNDHLNIGHINTDIGNINTDIGDINTDIGDINTNIGSGGIHITVDQNGVHRS